MIYILVVIQATKPVCIIKKQNPFLISSHKTQSNPKAGVMMNIRVGSKPSSPHPAENQATKPILPRDNQGATYPPGFIMPPPKRRATFRDVYKLINPLPWVLLVLLLLRIFK